MITELTKEHENTVIYAYGRLTPRSEYTLDAYKVLKVKRIYADLQPLNSTSTYTVNRFDGLIKSRSPFYGKMLFFESPSTFENWKQTKEKIESTVKFFNGFNWYTNLTEHQFLYLYTYLKTESLI